MGINELKRSFQIQWKMNYDPRQQCQIITYKIWGKRFFINDDERLCDWKVVLLLSGGICD